MKAALISPALPGLGVLQGVVAVKEDIHEFHAAHQEVVLIPTAAGPAVHDPKLMPGLLRRVESNVGREGCPEERVWPQSDDMCVRRTGGCFMGLAEFVRTETQHTAGKAQPLVRAQRGTHSETPTCVHSEER